MASFTRCVWISSRICTNRDFDQSLKRQLKEIVVGFVQEYVKSAQASGSVIEDNSEGRAKLD